MPRIPAKNMTPFFLYMSCITMTANISKYKQHIWAFFVLYSLGLRQVARLVESTWWMIPIYNGPSCTLFHKTPGIQSPYLRMVSWNLNLPAPIESRIHRLNFQSTFQNTTISQTVVPWSRSGKRLLHLKPWQNDPTNQSGSDMHQVNLAEWVLHVTWESKIWWHEFYWLRRSWDFFGKIGEH